MTVRQYIELVKHSLTGIPTIDDRSRHEEIIRQNIGRAYNQMLGDLTAKGYKNISPYTKLFKNVEVGKDTDTGIYYSLIPVDISPLTDIKSGIRSISPMTDSSLEFAPIDMEKIGYMSNLLVSRISSKIGYTVGKNEDGDLSVDYFGMTDDNALDYVKMYILIPFESYDDEDIIHIPAGQDQNLLTLVVKFLSGTPQKDLKYNNSEIK
jgi:hypothetical protein